MGAWRLGRGGVNMEGPHDAVTTTRWVRHAGLFGQGGACSHSESGLHLLLAYKA